jgi:hypothetical protein
MKAGPVTKIRYRRVCERPVDLLLNLGTRSKVTIYTYSGGPMRPHARAVARAPGETVAGSSPTMGLHQTPRGRLARGRSDRIWFSS